MMVTTVKHATISVPEESDDAMNIADREAGIAELAYLKAEQELCGSRKE
ncbi:MAG: hypothetical protein PHY54_14980 [Methylococcales bacterium]|nr:hypothetical protein [Methylococcales bacterium]